MAAVSPVLNTTEFGQSTPPHGPHTITVHLPGWDMAMRFRDGDMTIFPRLKSLYPRFSPFGPARQASSLVPLPRRTRAWANRCTPSAQLAAALGSKLGADPGKDGVLMFLDPATFSVHRAYGSSPHRKEHKLAEADLTFRIVDVRGVRLYVVLYPLPKTPGVVGHWQNAGTGASSRLSEELLRYVESGEFAVVDTWAGDVDKVPAPTYLPECEAHAELRRRIRGLLHRAPREPELVQVTEDDVYLYQTGMAAIYRLNEVLVRRDPGTVLVLGSIFHNTWHLFEEAPGGMKHFGACDATSGVMDKVEAYLGAHYGEGKTVSYAFVEFPSNPLLVSADLKRLRQIADKYAFPVVIDDTIGSFANIDVLPVADALITSLTKSFSGYADVMGGSAVLNPRSPSYPRLRPLLAASHRNELYAGDASVLLSNSADYLARTAVLNRNAAALAARLARAAAPAGPVKAVLYPTTSDTRAAYDAFKRRPAPGLPEPGYGCLLSVDFVTPEASVAFYDAVGSYFHMGPHLGGHRTLAICFNALVFGKVPEDARYHAAYGVTATQVRISVGLEDEAELVAAVEVALGKAEELLREGVGQAKVGIEEVVAKVDKAPGMSEADVKVAAEGTSANYE